MDKKRTCETCQKLNSYDKTCKVLTERIKGECWAWTDHVNWELEAIQSTKEYKMRKRVGK